MTMSGFELNSNWDVDKTAESLNNSLFGNHKAKKKMKKSGVSKIQNQDIDNDDEKLSKKEKKKLKEIRRKLNKSRESSDAGKTDSKATKRNNTILVKGETVKKKKTALIENTSEKNPKSKNNHKKKKVDKTPNKIENISESSLNGVSNTEIRRKRKRSESKDSDLAHKPKKVKVDQVLTTEKNTEYTNGTPAAKSKNRKKKNTSRKNREKQLALKNKPKPSLAVIVREIEASGSEAGSSKTAESHANVQKNVAQQSQLQANKGHKKKKSKKLSQDFSTAEASQTNVPQNSLSESKLNPGKKQSKKKSSKKSFENVNTVAQDVLRETQGMKKKKKEKKKIICEENIKDTHLFTDSGLKKMDKKAKKKNKKVNGLINNISDAETALEYKSHKNSKHEKKNVDSAKGIHPENSDKRSERKLQNAERKLQDAEAPPSCQSLWESSALGTKARDKLKSARFRFLNEQLYTCTGAEALQMFRKDREAFQFYHEGYENQVSKWPVNPVNNIIRQLKSKPVNTLIADFGCGDAKLAASLPHTVHSFDLVAVNDRVTVCDMSKTPLPNESVDIAVFCLSLMGTNIGDYILEANRILKDGGLLKIVEVVSRFKGVSEFIGGIYKRGFQLLNKRDVNEMFYQMDFKKVKTMKKSSSFGIMKLNPCLYKKR